MVVIVVVEFMSIKVVFDLYGKSHSDLCSLRSKPDSTKAVKGVAALSYIVVVGRDGPGSEEGAP